MPKEPGVGPNAANKRDVSGGGTIAHAILAMHLRAAAFTPRNAVEV